MFVGIRPAVPELSRFWNLASFSCEAQQRRRLHHHPLPRKREIVYKAEIVASELSGGSEVEGYVLQRAFVRGRQNVNFDRRICQLYSQKQSTCVD